MTDKVRCKEQVRDTWGSYDCARPAGYGEGAAYCKQHAKKHPSTDEVAAGKVKYWAEWEFSMPGLARVMVIGENALRRAKETAAEVQQKIERVKASEVQEVQE
jgi:hypothetical protein